jgi:hypothetical protein
MAWICRRLMVLVAVDAFWIFVVVEASFGRFSFFGDKY